MTDWHVQFFRCPYCGTKGGHEKAVNKTVGWFRIQQVYGNVLIMKCKKCSKTCRIQMVGSVLQWADMSAKEKQVFKEKSFNSYESTKLQEEKKNGKEI